MRKFWKWFFIVLAALIVLGIIAFVVIGLSSGFGRPGAFLGRHGGFMMIPGRIRGFGGPGLFSFHPGLMLIGMLLHFFAWLIPLGLLILFVWAIVRLTSLNKSTAVGTQSTPSPVAPPVESTPARTCQHCGKPAQSDWVTCPYCGAKL